MTPEEIQALRAKYYNARVVELKKPNPELMIARVRPDYPLAVHKPGQYGTLGLGFWEARVAGCQPETLAPGQDSKLIRRAYSISCSVLDDEGKLLDRSNADWLEFYIVLVRDSGTAEPPALTPRLFELKQGDKLFLGEKIAGNFTSAPIKPDDTVIFLGTGTGEAPHNYLLWELLAKGHRGKLLSVCCVRYQRDLGYLGIHEELMRRYAQYQYIPLTTREKAGGKQYIQDLLRGGEIEKALGQPLDVAHTQVYLCGNPKMIGVPVKDRTTGIRTFPQPPGVIEILEERGFRLDEPATKTVGNIHFEEFW